MNTVTLVIASANVAIQLLCVLVKSFKAMERSKKELERLHEKYEKIRLGMQSFSSVNTSLQPRMVATFQDLKDYFTEAEKDLNEMIATTKRSRLTLHAIWERSKFSVKIASLAAGCTTIENTLLQFTCFVYTHNDMLAMNAQIKELQAVVAVRLSRREEILLAFKIAMQDAQLETSDGVNALKFEVLSNIASNMLEQPDPGDIDEINVVGEDLQEGNILQWNDRMVIISSEILSLQHSSPVLPEVKRFINEIHSPWSLCPDTDFVMLYEEDASGQEITRTIGVGSTGIVYEGKVRQGEETHGAIDKDAALKVLHGSSNEAEAKGSFLREVQLLAELRHPCIVEFLGTYWPGDDDQGHSALIATELMSENISSLSPSSDMSRKILKILLDVAEGLEYLHDLGIVHMNIKPENVLIRVDKNGNLVGRAKLADFGSLCKNSSVCPQQQPETEWAIARTQNYMAPELKGPNPRARAPCDIWSFGLIMQSLCQEYLMHQNSSSREEQPFPVDNEISAAQVHSDSSNMLQNEDLDRIDELASKCLQEQPKKRPSAREVRLELLGIQCGIGSETIQVVHRKTLDVMYKEGIDRFLGIKPYCPSSACAWEIFVLAAKLGHTRSDSTLRVCFASNRTGLSEEQIIQLLQMDSENTDLMYLHGMCHVHGFGARRSPDAGVELLKKAAALGDTLASNGLGLCYQNGIGVETNEAESVELFDKAAKAGDASAQHSLAQCCAHGTQGGADLTKALALYHSATESGYSLSQESLAWYYQNGEHVGEDVGKAFMLYQLAASAGVVPALREVGYCFENGVGTEKNETKAVALYREAATAGDVIGRNRLADCYAKGIGVERNLTEAVALYQQGADDGNALARYKLGQCFEFGRGVEKNPQTAVDLYRRAAHDGDQDAQIRLAWCYQHGVGVEHNAQLGFSLYQQMADNGITRALGNIGWCYENAVGTAKDERKAVRLYEQGTDAGDSFAQSQLAKCYLRGTGVHKNFTKAVELSQLAASAGDASALVDVARFCESGTDVRRDVSMAVELYQTAADSGDASGNYNLGRCYQSGLVVEENHATAVTLYQHAADSGHAPAQRALGWCYEQGFGARKDLRRAVGLYLRAARAQHNSENNLQFTRLMNDEESGDNLVTLLHSLEDATIASDATVAYYLAMCYEKGLSVNADETKAFELYKEASYSGNMSARVCLGKCYQDGRGTNEDAEKAVLLFRQAADFGNASAMCNLGLCYQLGRGVETNLSEAVKWFETSARSGHAAAQNYLGYFHESGTEVPTNRQMAAQLYQQAALSGNVSAQVNLGRCHEEGIGVDQNFAEAFRLYEQAANAGDANAMFLLGSFYEKGTGTTKNLKMAKTLYEKAASFEHRPASRRLANFAFVFKQHIPTVGDLVPKSCFT